jgi:hypothetical protein
MSSLKQHLYGFNFQEVIRRMGVELFTILVASMNLMMYTIIITSSILARKGSGIGNILLNIELLKGQTDKISECAADMLRFCALELVDEF